MTLVREETIERVEETHLEINEDFLERINESLYEELGEEYVITENDIFDVFECRPFPERNDALNQIKDFGVYSCSIADWIEEYVREEMDLIGPYTYFNNSTRAEEFYRD